MGKKGEKRSGEAKAAADELVGRLSSMDGVSAKGMFGGYGVFDDGVMFALVNRAGVLHLRVTDDTVADFVERGADRHGKMPYYEIPEDVLNDDATLRAWAMAAAAGARAEKRG